MSYQKTPVGTQVVRNAKELEKIQILERRKYAMDCIEFYYKQHASGIAPNEATVKSSIKVLFIMIAPSIKSDDDEMFWHIKSFLDNDKSRVHEFIELFYQLNEWCYLKGFRWDDLKIYDSTDVEAENEAFNL